MRECESQKDRGRSEVGQRAPPKPSASSNLGQSKSFFSEDQDEIAMWVILSGKGSWYPHSLSTSQIHSQHRDRNIVFLLAVTVFHSPCSTRPCLGLHGDSSIPGVKSALTHNLDDLSQEDTVRHILLEILDETFVA